MERYDYLIVGAGFSGIVIAERLASIGKKVLLIDKRSHFGGNCYDFINRAGILVHKYGPHYFRTDYEEVLSYLSKFTEWTSHRYKVKVNFNEKIYSFPINKKTFEEFFNLKFSTKEELSAFLESKRNKDIITPKNAEETILSKLGPELYSAFFEGYTQKQWGVHPKLLDVSVTERIPIRLDDNDDYLNNNFQAMPSKGYTQMFKKMLSNKNIKIMLNKPFSKKDINRAKKVIWTGRIDEFFNFKFGKLPYRGLNFAFFNFYNQEFFQECGQINYTSASIPYTRILEIKHITHQKSPHTTISLEFPTDGGEPCYPIPTLENKKLYEKYLDETKKYETVHFLGRLGKYQYLNMDQCVKEALMLFEKIKNEIN